MLISKSLADTNGALAQWLHFLFIKNGVVFVMSCSKGGVGDGLPPAGFCPDSQNFCFDTAKISIFPVPSKFFLNFLC